MVRRTVLPVFTFLIFALVGAASAAPTAQSLIQKAMERGRIERKNVLIDFRASWCPWCVKTEELFESNEFKDKFRQNYIICSITVREDAAHTADENLGWQDVMLQYRNAKEQDIPYIVIISGHGKKLADSYRAVGDKKIPDNAGFPETMAEVTAYLTMIKETSSTFSDKDLDALRAYFATAREKKSSE